MARRRLQMCRFTSSRAFERSKEISAPTLASVADVYWHARLSQSLGDDVLLVKRSDSALSRLVVWSESCIRYNLNEGGI